MNDDRSSNSGVNRRRFLQRTSVAGVGLVGVGTVTAAAGEKRGTVTFTASAVTHDVGFPSEEARVHSLIAVNTLPEHAVFEEEGILSYNHFTTRETARMLEENPAGLWHEDYRGLPVSNVGRTQRRWIGVEAIDHPRITKGILIEDAYRPPAFGLTQRDDRVRVTVGSEQTEVAPGERFQQELPPRELAVRVSHHTEGTTGEPASEGDGTATSDRDSDQPYSVRQLTATPTVHVTNYGELTIRAPDDWTPRQLQEQNGEDWAPSEREESKEVNRR